MKNFVLYTLALLGLFATACDPMEDIHADMDKELMAEKEEAVFFAQFEKAPEAHVLTDADYELSSDEGVRQYKNFSKYAEPQDFLPEILNKRFTAPNTTEMMVTYNYYEKPFVDEDNAYELESDDYTEMGQYYPNFDDEDAAEYAIPIFLNEKYKYEKVAVGTQQTVKYNFYQSAQSRYLRVNDDNTVDVLDYEGDDSYELVDADYESLGNGNYNNFYSIEEAQEKIVTFSIESGKGAGNYTCFVYRNYFDRYVVCQLGDEGWSELKSVMPVSGTVAYKVVSPDYTQSYWKFMLPLKFVKVDKAHEVEYTLTDDDYALVGNGQYKNFDVREGKGEESEEVRIEKISTILKANFDVVAGDVYKVHYKVYNGQAEMWEITLEAIEG
ncbi:hypothetical protein [Carboxylicivirga marina]|uniref:Uncharacterized protein n=1 Tax=Carboxylicivirga marina TaxID=2800988 RepID=A0ABS1HKB0_9BACT|nr:hypothetical protein [Carboxylicivirga marina]MBK3518109.1 hypothetical protein [Carboxylicivirga marina]